jgi:putative transposase
MERAYRTLVLKYDLLKLPPEVAEKVSALLKVQEEFRRWATEWLRGKAEKPERNPLKYFVVEFLYAGKALDWLYGVKNGATPKRLKPPLIFNAQLRLDKEKDFSRGVFVDIPKREVKVRRWGGTLVLPLGDKAVNWILARVEEGGKLVLAAVWVGPSKRNRVARLHVALVFRREVVPMQPRRLLVIDLNALHNGLAWAVVEEGRIVEKNILRPHVSKILHLQKVMAKLDSVCAEKDEACGEASAVKSRTWRMLRAWEDEAVKKLVRLALQYKATVIVDIPNDGSVRELKKSGYTAERKIFLNFGRIRRRLRGLAEWYGVPYREERLYSTVCPRCGRKMEELSNRRVRCVVCGFEVHRDVVPALWAVKRFLELATPSFSSSSAASLLWKLKKGSGYSPSCLVRNGSHTPRFLYFSTSFSAFFFVHRFFQLLAVALTSTATPSSSRSALVTATWSSPNLTAAHARKSDGSAVV